MQTSRLDDIATRFWQPALSTQSLDTQSLDGAIGLLDNQHGLVATDSSDIAQCVYTILSTPLGSDPHRPHFGSRLDEYIDYPISSARPYIAREVHRALKMWEPRLDLVKVDVHLAAAASAHLEVTIHWRITGDHTDDVFVTNLALGQLI